MQVVFPNQANIVYLPLAARSNGTAVTSGTVNFYLIAITGTNAGKWFRDSDDTWQASEALCGTATHKARGHWLLSIAEAAWTDEVRYLLYGDESGQLAVPVEDEIWCNTIQKMQKADKIVITTETPWEVEHRDRESADVLLTKTMKNTDGENITNENNVLGQLEDA